MLAFGTRLEAIKMAPVYRALRERTDVLEPVCCVTTQHRQIPDQVLETFRITPGIDFDLMQAGQGLTHVTSAVLASMRAVLRDERPDVVLVHGDTTTTMAAFYAEFAVGHVEAGLGTFDMRAPFPEEFNRRLTGMLARYHFAPTQTSQANPLAEGCDPSSIVVTGNTVIDALHFILEPIGTDPEIRRATGRKLDETTGFDWRRRRYVLITGHRRKNFGGGFEQICEALGELSDVFPDVDLVDRVHLDPNVREPVNAFLAGRANVHLIEPMTYEPFLYGLRHSYLVLTDSGGIQEEAPSLGKPVLVMREVTERPETVDEGTVRLVGADRARIVAGVSELLSDAALHDRMSAAHNPFGDGLAAHRISDFLEQN